MAQDPRPIRILIVDDHAAVRGGLSAILDAEDDFEVMGAAGDGEEAIRMASEEHPDIVLMDYSMPGMDGPEASERLRVVAPEARVIFLTSFGDRDRMMAAFKAGAVSYLLKDAPPNNLVKGIRIAAEAIGRVDR